MRTASNQRLIRAAPGYEYIAAAAAADQSGKVAGVIKHRVGTGTRDQRIMSSGPGYGVSSRTAGYGVAASADFNDIVAAILQRDGVGTVAGRDHHVAVARYGKILRTACILEDDGLKLQRILIGVDAVGAGRCDIENLRRRRDRERRRSDLNRYQARCVLDPARVAATD